MTAATTSTGEHSRGLDVVRGIAAVLVVLGHARGDLFLVHGLEPEGSGLVRLALVPASFAQEAVAVFFVLSGYLVGGQVLRQVRGGRFRWPVYLAKRMSRLWTVLIPGLVITVAVDAVARSVDRTAVAALEGMGSSSPGTGVCNALFLMPTRCDTFGSNESLWSLSYELWFYVVFAAATVATYAARRRRTVVALVNLAVAAGSVLLFGVGVLWLFPAWLLGVVVADVRSRVPEWGRVPKWGRWGAAAQWSGAVGVLLLSFVGSNLLRPVDGVRELLVAVATVPLVWLCLERPARTRRRWIATGEWLGIWSYSMYVYHRPFVALAAVSTSAWWGADPQVTAGALYVVALVVLFVVYPLYRLTEHHTEAIRDLALRLTRLRWGAVGPGPGPARAVEGGSVVTVQVEGRPHHDA